MTIPRNPFTTGFGLVETPAFGVKQRTEAEQDIKTFKDIDKKIELEIEELRKNRKTNPILDLEI